MIEVSPQARCGQGQEASQLWQVVSIVPYSISEGISSEVATILVRDTRGMIQRQGCLLQNIRMEDHCEAGVI